MWQRLTPRELAVACRFVLLRARYPHMRGGPFSLGPGHEIRLEREARVQVGRGVRFSRDFSAYVLGTLQIGDGVFFNRGCSLAVYSSLQIGAGTLFGEYVSIHDENHALSPLELPLAQRGYTVAPITIGSNVWVAAKVTILPGVQIGDNAVIGANAVVTGPIPANSVAVGAPARVVRMLI